MKCKICNKEIKLKRRKTCSNECLAKIRKHTPKIKKIIAKKRKEFLKNNKNKHNWSMYKNKESKPEKAFKKIINKINKEIIQYYIPPENDRFYELDFADINNKIGFEINGNQHYEKNGLLTDYYQKRHNYFIEYGWKIIEIYHILCFNENEIRKILQETYKGNINYSENKTNEIFTNKLLKKQKKEEEKNKKKEIKQKKIIKIKTELIKSNINFKKFGWVTKVSKIIGISPSKTSSWIKRNIPDFWNEKKPYIRKSPRIVTVF